MAFYKTILAENLEGVAYFIARLGVHEGITHVERLYTVKIQKGSPIICKGQASDKKNNFSLVTGGEVINSFSPLYEIGYFFSSLFLAAIGTVVIQKKLIDKHRRTKSKNLLALIKSELNNLTEEEIISGIKNPIISIVCSMDTDVVPLRYLKHQLWRISPKALTKRVAEIKPNEYGKAKAPKMNKLYWTKEDEKIAEFAMKHSPTLQTAKAIQYYLVLKIFLEELDVDIKNIPLYFNFVPKEEIIENGPDSSFIKVLAGLHTSKARLAYRKITGIDKPWIITKACPQCGQGDKRIVSSKLMSDGVTVKAHCKPYVFSFHNEHGDTQTVKGCGNKFSFTIPTDHQELYDFLKNEDFSIHFAARELLSILKDSAVNPIGFVATELGVVKGYSGKLMRAYDQTKDYGDNLDMLISAIGMQYFFINNGIAQEVSKKLKRTKKLLQTPVMLFAYDKPTELVDPEVKVKDAGLNPLYVSDTSALKVLRRGLSVKEIFKKAVRVYSFNTKDLYRLKGKSIEEINNKLIVGKSDDYLNAHDFNSGSIDQIKSNKFFEFV